MNARRPRRPGAVFLLPILLALVSTIGLVAALTGDGLRDAVSWIALSLPVAAFARAHVRRR